MRQTKTRFDLDGPELEDPNRKLTPYEMGEMAAYHSMRSRDCPFDYGTVEAQDWMEAFLDMNERGIKKNGGLLT